FTLTVWADDLTGLPGHNTSDSGSVYVYNPSANKKPTGLLLSVDDNTPYTGQVVTFSASASDPDGDPLKFTIAFGDGTYYVESFGGTAEGEVVSLTAEKSYATAGSPTAFLYVSDGIDNVTSNSVVLTVTLNFAPTLSALSDVYGVPGTPINVVADVYDLDDDPLVYTWVWGDGGVSVSSVESASHTYIVGDNYAYRVYVDDGHEHNVTDAAFAYINTVPVLEPLVDVSLDGGEVHTFEATATDADPNDVLSYTWDFGDGTGFEFGPAVEHLYIAEGSYGFAVWVDDGFALIGHNISSSATAAVIVADTEDPVADAGPDQSVLAGELVTFDAVGSSDNVAIVSWAWTFMWDGSPVDLTGEEVTFVFDSPLVDVTVTLTVMDAAGNSDTDEMVVHVGDWIPEFSALLLPVAGTIVMLGALVYVRRRRQ
ncbi:MAG TPA: PKD domain-containing protein, partial [Candidatus Paceibacterota bacterium]|nr:PKD domain-containing protein [Candidatus Paceibacterota bacterium]